MLFFLKLLIDIVKFCYNDEDCKYYYLFEEVN